MKKVTILSSIESIRIYIDELLHLHVHKSEYVGLQSWHQTDKDYTNKYCIEIVCKTTSITVEYQDINIWKSVLQLLDQKL